MGEDNEQSSEGEGMDKIEVERGSTEEEERDVKGETKGQTSGPERERRENDCDRKAEEEESAANALKKDNNNSFVRKILSQKKEISPTENYLQR